MTKGEGRLLETDQVHCYDEKGQPIACEGTGQDASYGKTAPMQGGERFRVQAGVVRDTLTGAVWSKDANVAEFPLSWDEARQWVAEMQSEQAHGYANWQLPSRRLLFSLISHQHINPSLPSNHPFDNVFTGYYWSADRCLRLPNQAWYVHLGGGRVHRGMKHGSYLVWPVSPGHPSEAADRFPGERLAGGMEGVHDHHTGLTWSKNADPVGRPLSWPEALSAVQAFNRHGLADHHDWRLPNIRELESLVDLDSHSPALPADHPFVNVRDAYWSSTTSVYEPRYAWTLYTRDGMVGVGFKPGIDFYLWPVRNG